MKTALAMLVIVCAVSGAAFATDYNDAADGDWNNAATWGGAGWPGDGLGVADTAVIDSNTVILNTSPNPADLAQVTLAGGTLETPWGTTTLASGVDVTAPSFLTGGYYTLFGATFTGAITGGSLLTVNAEDRYVRVDSVNNTFSGGWKVDSGQLIVGGATQALGTGIATINSGATLNATELGNISGVAAAFNGGNYYLRGNNTFSGTIDVQAGGMTVTGATDYGHDNPRWDVGVLAGSGKITVDSDERVIRIIGAQDDFSGAWEIVSGGVIVDAPGALGTNTAPVVVKATGGGGFNHGLILLTIDNATLPNVTLDGGQIFNMVNRATSAFAKDVTVTANGGKLFTADWNPYGTSASAEYSGTITLDGNLEVSTVDWRDTYISGELTGAGKVTKTGGSMQYGNTLYLSNVGISFTGGVDVIGGAVQVDAAGALGSGEAVAKGGTILSNIDDAFASASQVVSDANGTVDINSTENNATLRIKPGGALKVSGGSTVMNYTGTPIGGQATVYVEAGCILYEGFTHPTADQFEVGDEGFGAFKATTTGDHTVGKYSETIYRGLANTAGVATFSGSVTEAAATPPDDDPTEGIGMLATGPATFQYQGSTFTTVNTNTIKFYGAGAHVIQDSNTFNNDLEMMGDGRLVLDTWDAITGHTLNVNSGCLEVTDDNALGSAVANINSGALFNLGGRTLYSGTIHVNSGGVVAWDRTASIFSGTTWDFQPGSGLLLTVAWDPSFDYPLGAVPASIYAHDDGRGLFTKFEGSDVPMGDGCRVTMAAIDATTGHSTSDGVFTKGGAKFHVAPGNDSGRFTAATGATMVIGGMLDFTGKVLIIGDVDPHLTPIAGGASGFALLGQAGTVVLTDRVGYLGNEGPTTVVGIGAIDVQAGTFRMQRNAMLGGAAEIHINGGARMDFAYDEGADPVLTNTMLTGTGIAGINGGRTLRADAGATISPGDSIGVLTIDGNLALANDGVDYGALAIEIAAPADHDQVAVTGNLSVGGGNLAVTMNVPSVNYKPAGLTGLDIATCGGTLDTTPFNAIVTGALDNVDPSPAVRAAVAAHWTIEAADVTYDDTGGKIVLDASEWTGFPGDADLNDFVDLADLSTLAFNWEESTGMTWLTADFDLNGTVNLADLSVLAFNWEKGPPGGAPPVPEPMTVGLLVVGGVALLRRRRR